MAPVRANAVDLSTWVSIFLKSASSYTCTDSTGPNSSYNQCTNQISEKTGKFIKTVFFGTKQMVKRKPDKEVTMPHSIGGISPKKSLFKISTIPGHQVFACVDHFSPSKNISWAGHISIYSYQWSNPHIIANPYHSRTNPSRAIIEDIRIAKRV